MKLYDRNSLQVSSAILHAILDVSCNTGREQQLAAQETADLLGSAGM